MYFIYFIKVAENIKIGICKATLKNLKQRLSEANRWSPNSEILGVILYDDDKLEKAIHYHFSQYKISNEIFKNDKNIQKFIKKYCHWEKSRRYISYCWSTIQWAKIKSEVDQNFNRFKYRNNKAKPSIKLSLYEWCKYGELRHKLNNIVDKMFEDKELIYFDVPNEDCDGFDSIVKKLKPNANLSIYPETYPTGWIAIEAYEEFDLQEFEEELWHKISETQLLDIEYTVNEAFLHNKILSNYLSFLRSKQNEVDEDDYEDERDDDFTGIGDDGFYYVDGDFCITDPLGVDAY